MMTRMSNTSNSVSPLPTKSYKDKKTRKADIAKDLDSILEKLAQASEDIQGSDLFKSWLTTCSKFHNYSFGNQMLIASQKEEASKVGGKKFWWNLGYKLQKGCSAIWILAPMIGKKEVKGIEETACFGFRTVMVFDVSDVEPRTDKEWVAKGKDPAPLANGLSGNHRTDGGADHLIAALEAFIASKNWGLSYESMRDSCGGYSAGGKIVVNTKREGAARAGTLAHEIAHELMHWNQETGGKAILTKDHSKSWIEVEAESTSYAIMHSQGIDQDSEFYLAAWGGTKDIVKKSLTRIQKAVNEVVKFVEGYEVESDVVLQEAV